MGDSYQTAVFQRISEDQARTGADALRGWMVRERLIEAETSDSDLDGLGGHRPGPAYQDVCEPDDGWTLELATNGVSFRVGRDAAYTLDTELRCAACRTVFRPEMDAWMESVQRWQDGDDDAAFACPSCGSEAPLVDWDGPSRWGFGTLAVTFWNWPALKDGFLERMRSVIGHEAVLVRGRV